MPVACYNALERLLPHIRARAARNLRSKGLRQVAIAQHLGVSQAMVSRYLRKLPPAPAQVASVLLDQVVASTTQQALEADREGRVGAYCATCTALDQHGLTGADEALSPHDECMRHDQVATHDQRDAVLKALAKAGQWIPRLDLSRLQPEVRINLAVALPDARDPREVAAFPGRLVTIDGTTRPVAAPDFGASTHLSTVLLRARATRPEWSAMMNVRWAGDVEDAAVEAGLSFHTLTRRADQLALKLPNSGGLDGFVDPGGFGVEPNLYLAGATPDAVLEHAARLLSKLPTTPKGAQP